jgi:hypothetical protein
MPKSSHTLRFLTNFFLCISCFPHYMCNLFHPCNYQYYTCMMRTNYALSQCVIFSILMLLPLSYVHIFWTLCSPTHSVYVVIFIKVFTAFVSEVCLFWKYLLLFYSTCY